MVRDMGEFHPNQLSAFGHHGSISNANSSGNSDTSSLNNLAIQGNMEDVKEGNEMKGNKKEGDESKHEGNSYSNHITFYQSLAFLLHIASCLGINVIGIKNGTICICPYRAAAAGVALLVVFLSLVMTLGIIFSIDASYQQKVLILPLFSANCFCCYTQIFWLIKSKSIANFLVEVEAFKLKINRSYPIKVAVCYSFCYSIIYTVFVYLMVPLPDHIFTFRNSNFDYMLTFPVFVTCFIPSMFDLYIFTFTLFLVVALERLQNEIQTIKVWSKEETSTVAKNWIECRKLLGIFNGVFSYLLHVRIILFVVHAIAHLFALTSMKYTKDCAFYFWPLLFSLLENSTRYLGICQTGQHLMNTHFLVVKAVREALIKQCLPDADQNLEGDDTSSWLFIDYETGKHDSTIEEFKPIKLEVTTIKVSEKTISMTDTTKLKRAAAAESTTLETLNLDEISFQNADVNATEERLMEMEVNCFHNYEERYTRRNYFFEETHKEEKLLLKETKNEETTENVSLILDETNTQVVPNETGRPSLLCTNDLENSSKAKEIHAIGDHLQSTVEEPNTLENTQSDKVCYTAKQEGMKEFNPRNKNDDHEMSGSTCATSFPSGSTYRANGSDLSIESKSNVDQVACSEYELQELKDVRVSNVLHPSMHVSDLKQTHFAGGACKEEAFIESKIPSLDAIQKESLLAHDFSCDNDECICKNADFFANEGTFENKRNSGLDIELTCDDKSTKLKETMIIDEVINEGNTNIELKETIVVEEVTYGDDENTELKGTVIVDKDTYGDTKNTEAKGMINVTEMTFEDKNKNTEPKEIIFVDGVTNEDDRNTELDVSVFVNEVTYEYDTNIEVQETIFAGEDTYVDNEDTGVKEAIFVDKGNCEDVQNTEVKEIILVDGVTYEGKIEGVTYEDNRNTEPQEDIFFVWVSNEDDENTELDKSVFVDEVTCEDNQNTEIQEKGYDGSHEENNMTETIEKYIVNELVSENNTSIPKIEVLLSCEVKPESKNIKQTNAYPIEGVIRKDEDTRQTESFTVNEVTCNFKDLRKIDTFLVDDVTNEHDIVMGQKGTCIACKESNGRKESSSTDVLACAGNKVSGRSEQIYEGEVTCKDENVSCSEDIIFTEDDTSKGIYSWEEKSFLAGKAFNECDQDLGLKMKSHQTPEKAQVSLKCNQHFTKNGPVITGDVSYERGDKKPQVMLLVDKIACNDSQLPNQNASLTSTVTCEEISVLKEHSSPIKTYFPYRQSLDKKLEFIQYSENKETATEAFYAKPLCQSKEQKEILATNTEVPVSETSNLEENYIELNKTPSIDKEVCECIEDLQLRGDSTEIGPLDRLCLQRFMCHLEEFSFSADVWGAHPLSASSYVTCLGIVVTYLLMVLQLQPILSDDTGEKDLDNLLDDQGIFQCFSK